MGLDYLIRALLNAMTSAVANAMDMMGSSVIALLSPNIGSGSSIFEAIFSSFGDLLGLFQIMGLALLMINFAWQIMKIMSSQQAAEDPVALVATTVFAGLFIYIGADIIYILEDFISYIYEFILNIGGADTSMHFYSMANNVASITSGSGAAGNSDVLASDMAGTSLGSLFVTFIMTLWLAYQFFLYMVEVVERYVLLGVLYYTAPMAFAFAGSKSTRNIFGSWVKMVGSQLFLMICNVLFFKLFVYGFSRFDDSMAAISGGETATTSDVIVWCLILFGILYVGQRVDSYLSTLGLSAAQTGRGMGAALVASALGASRALQSAGRVASGTYRAGSRFMNNTKAGRHIKSSIAEMAGRAAYGAGITGRSVGANGVKAAAVAAGYGTANYWNKNSAEKVSGRPVYDAANSVVGTKNRTASKIASSMDVNQTKINNADGSIEGTIYGANGAAAKVDIRKNENGALDNVRGQHFVDANGDKSVMTFQPADKSAASRAFANQLSMRDDGLQEVLQQRYGSTHSITQLPNGAYDVRRTDSQGRTVEALQFAKSDCLVNNSAAVNVGKMQSGQFESDGNVSCIDYTAAQRAREETGYASFSSPVHSSNQADQAMCLKDNFAQLRDASLFNANLWNEGSDIHTFSMPGSDGQIHNYAMANAYDYALNKSGNADLSVSATLLSNNGIKYDLVDLGVQGSPESYLSPSDVFVHHGAAGFTADGNGVAYTGRGAGTDTINAGPTTSGDAPSMFTPTRPITQQELHSNSSNQILKTSMNRNAGNSKRDRRER